LDQLINNKVNSIESWEYLKLIKYYYIKGELNVIMVDAKFNYSYEYQGNNPKLVHTPLTDKC